jgi:uroporphyrinogen-III synthase
MPARAVCFTLLGVLPAMLSGPLAGKRIVLTRTAEQSAALSRLLERNGAEVGLLPCVEFGPPQDFAPLDEALRRISEFAWLIFTSRNAVKYVSRRLREVRCDPVNLAEPRPKVAAIGAATRDSAIRAGWDVDRTIPNVRSGAEFASQIARRVRGAKILLPQSDLAAPGIAGRLCDAGAMVTSVVAYRTCVPESLDNEEVSRVCRDGTDAIVIASPSAFRNFVHAAGESHFSRIADNSAFVAIGPTTARAIFEAGIRVSMEAATPNPYGIVKAMKEYFSQPKFRPRAQRKSKQRKSSR